MPAPIEVRRAVAGDLGRIASVWHESASHMEAAASPMPSPADLRRRIDDELTAGWALYLAERGDRLIGMLALKPREAVLDQIFVLPGEQGKGVGTALLRAAKEALPAGFTLRMAAANRGAARFYERSGLQPIGEGTHPVSGDPVRFYRWEG